MMMAEVERQDFVAQYVKLSNRVLTLEPTITYYANASIGEGPHH